MISAVVLFVNMEQTDIGPAIAIEEERRKLVVLLTDQVCMSAMPRETACLTIPIWSLQSCLRPRLGQATHKLVQRSRREPVGRGRPRAMNLRLPGIIPEDMIARRPWANGMVPWCGWGKEALGQIHIINVGMRGMRTPRLHSIDK